MRITSVNNQNINSNQSFRALRFASGDAKWLQRKIKEKDFPKDLIEEIVERFDKRGYDIFLKRKIYETSILVNLVKKNQPVDMLFYQVCVNSTRDGSFKRTMANLDVSLERMYMWYLRPRRY